MQWATARWTLSWSKTYSTPSPPKKSFFSTFNFGCLYQYVSSSRLFNQSADQTLAPAALISLISRMVFRKCGLFFRYRWDIFSVYSWSTVAICTLTGDSPLLYRRIGSSYAFGAQTQPSLRSDSAVESFHANSNSTMRPSERLRTVLFEERGIEVNLWSLRRSNIVSRLSSSNVPMRS